MMPNIIANACPAVDWFWQKNDAEPFTPLNRSARLKNSEVSSEDTLSNGWSRNGETTVTFDDPDRWYDFPVPQ